MSSIHEKTNHCINGFRVYALALIYSLSSCGGDTGQSTASRQERSSDIATENTIYVESRLELLRKGKNTGEDVILNRSFGTLTREIETPVYARLLSRSEEDILKVRKLAISFTPTESKTCERS